MVGLIEEVILNRMPRFMRGPNLGRLLKAFAAPLDGDVEALRQGLTFSNPLLCPRELLPEIARDRGLPMYPGEPEEATRLRLSRWLQLHRQRGSHEGAMRHAQPYFLGLGTALPTIRIVHQGGVGPTANWHTLTPQGAYSKIRRYPSNFDFDGTGSTKWARWWVFIYMSGTGIAPPNTYDDGHAYNDGARYDCGGLSAQNLVDIPGLFTSWKRAGTWCGGVALVWDAGDVDPTGTPAQDASGWWSLPNGAGTWARPYNPATHLATRPPRVQWIYDNPG